MNREDINYRQGRSKKQIESSYKAIEWSFKLFIILGLISFLFS